MEILQNNWFLLIVAVFAFAGDVYLRKPGSHKGWRGLIRALCEMLGVACVFAMTFGKQETISFQPLVIAVVAVALVRVIMVFYPPSHER